MTPKTESNQRKLNYEIFHGFKNIISSIWWIKYKIMTMIVFVGLEKISLKEGFFPLAFATLLFLLKASGLKGRCFFSIIHSNLMYTIIIIWLKAYDQRIIQTEWQYIHFRKKAGLYWKYPKNLLQNGIWLLSNAWTTCKPVKLSHRS